MSRRPRPSASHGRRRHLPPLRHRRPRSDGPRRCLAFRIQVGNAFDGRPLTVGQAFLRWVGLGWLLWGLVLLPPVASVAPFVALIWPLVLLVTAVRSPFKQGLHDRFANSAVVRPRDASSRGAVLACGLIVVVFALLVGVAIVVLIYLGGVQAGRNP